MAVWFVTVPLGLNMTPNSRCRWVPVAHAQTHIHGIWVGYRFAHLNLGKADKMRIITVLPIPILGSIVVSGVA